MSIKPVFSESLLMPLPLDAFKRHQLQVFIKRDDLLHPEIGGNKWRKLRYNIAYMQQNNLRHILSFGGPFSNHIYALAAASRLFNFTATGCIRGPQLDMNNPTLRFAQQCGMHLIALSRTEYRRRDDPEYLQQWATRYPEAHIVPEGGSNALALPGVVELAHSLPSADFVIVPVGSGGTLAGLIEGLDTKVRIIGIAVLKQADYLYEKVKALSPKAARQTNWHIETAYHEGGYAKFSDELWAFCSALRPQLPLEPIYSGKMLFALVRMANAGFFPQGSTIIAIHTGGLQGLAGLRYCGRIQ